MNIEGMTPLPEELVRAFGTPDDCFVLEDGATAWAWDVDLNGETLAIARSATDDVDDVLRQIAAIRAHLDTRGLTLNQLVVALRLSGTRRFHERPDLLFVDEALQLPFPWCRVVVFSDISRISRSREGAELFIGELLELEVGLELATWDAAADEISRSAIEVFEIVEETRTRGRDDGSGDGPKGV